MTPRRTTLMLEAILGPEAERPSRLTPAQERDLISAVEGGDTQAARALVEAFLPAISATARRYRGRSVERQELLQEGVAGLLFAARRYDRELNTPFWAYASFWVRKAMQELVAELTRPVALSDRAARDLARIRAAHEAHLQSHGVEPSVEQLTAATGLTPAQLGSLLATERTPRGLEERLGVGDETAATVGDMVPDPFAEQDYQRVLDKIEIQEVRELADQLDERERAVIRAHYGLGRSPQTLSEIGTGLGLTAERARQIEVNGLTKLRAALTQSALPGNEPNQ